MSNKQRLLVRTHPNGGLVFAIEEHAIRTDAIYRALREAKTWGQFRRMLPDGEWQNIKRMVGRAGREEASFEGYEAIPQASDGDYPPWLQQQMDQILPNEILNRFGTLQSTSINGSYWHIDADRADEVSNALREMGFEVATAAHLKFF